MTSHTEAREVVARMLSVLAFEYANGGSTVIQDQAKYIERWYSEQLDAADAILARLSELGYVQRDRLTSDEAVEAACRKQTNTPHPAWQKPGQRDLMRSAISAAIAKAGEPA